MRPRTLFLCVLLIPFVLLTPCEVRAEDPAGPPADAGRPKAGPPETANPSATKPPTKPVNTDPKKGDAPLPATSGWHASLMIDNDGVGIWTVKSYQVFDHLGCPEVVGLDDKGRCHVLMSYSGRWTPISILSDGKWLGGLTAGDIDPRVKGTEVYTGSQRGNIYQVRAHGHTLVDGRLIARIEGREIHTLVAGDLDPRSPGKEVIVFTRPGGLYRLSPTAKDGGFTLTKLADLQGRVRDAIVLPAAKGETPRIACVSRTGRLQLLQITKDGPRWTTVYRAAMGKGRLARKPGGAGDPLVLYTTHDDGRILRHEESPTGWKHETIYLGPQGPRGIAAGVFDADPKVETVAIFGYSAKVELLTKRADGWKAETLFEDSDKGHWLCTAEVDGRNGTRELVSSGYSGRVVLLARPPGYGRSETATKR